MHDLSDVFAGQNAFQVLDDNFSESFEKSSHVEDENSFVSRDCNVTTKKRNKY